MRPRKDDGILNELRLLKRAEELREFLASIPEPPGLIAASLESPPPARPSAPPEPPASTAPAPAANENPGLVWMADRKSRGIDWLWEGRIPLGKCTLLVGDPDSGKSFVALDLAARVSRGVGVEPEGGPDTPGRVLLLAADDDVDDTILPRLEAAGADLSKVALLPSFVTGTRPGSQRLLSLSSDIERIEAALDEVSDCARRGQRGEHLRDALCRRFLAAS